MKKSLLIKLSLLIFSLSIFSSPGYAIDIGDTAPNWVLENGSGDQIDFYQASEGKISVLIYWATWCPYCASLMPHLQQVADEYQGEQVNFYAMNIIENADPVQHLKDKGHTFELTLKADVTMDGYGVRGTPSVFVVDGNHKVIFRRIPDTPDADVKTAVRDAIVAAMK
ncbi:MAG: cytochrome c biogenesis protein CcmG/thiol:disulfide interchange protein DsbE [Gammaproteobacteria bacterium]|jgi:cytochrome c biogenesis protein CcmG/thiol:disulfide interchange protein DsbE